MNLFYRKIDLPSLSLLIKSSLSFFIDKALVLYFVLLPVFAVAVGFVAVITDIEICCSGGYCLLSAPIVIEGLGRSYGVPRSE